MSRSFLLILRDDNWEIELKIFHRESNQGFIAEDKIITSKPNGPDCGEEAGTPAGFFFFRSAKKIY